MLQAHQIHRLNFNSLWGVVDLLPQIGAFGWFWFCMEFANAFFPNGDNELVFPGDE